jgi:DNA-binding beta-propeller fold protein YncE
VFEVARGRFTGPAPLALLALLPDGRSLVDEHTGGGLALIDPARPTPVSDPGGSPEGVAVSPDATRVVSLELENNVKRLVVRKLPSLERVRVTPLGPGLHETGVVGFLADGREVVSTSYPCVIEACSDAVKKETGSGSSCQHFACPDPALLVVDGGAPRPLDPRLTGLRAAAIATGGELAAVVRADGSAALVALPSGESLAPLPAQGDAAVEALAVSPLGDRIAVAVEGHLRVYARHGAGFAEVLDSPRRSTSSLAFAADGRSLFAGDTLAVYREGVEPRKTPALPYDVTLPPGFERLVEKNDGIGFKNSDSRTWALPEDLVAMFGEARHGASVTVLALDADELGGEGDAATWGRRVAARVLQGWSVVKTKNADHADLEAWGDEPGSRSVELHSIGHGCEDVESYYRIAERDGALYEVHLEIEGLLGKKRLTPWLRAFLDAPLGVAPSRDGKGAPPAERHAKKKKKHPHKKARK